MNHFREFKRSTLPRGNKLMPLSFPFSGGVTHMPDEPKLV
jgi:hypothetical protein